MIKDVEIWKIENYVDSKKLSNFEMREILMSIDNLITEIKKKNIYNNITLESPKRFVNINQNNNDSPSNFFNGYFITPEKHVRWIIFNTSNKKYIN